MSILRIGCTLFNTHKFKLAQKLNLTYRRVGCTRCNRSFVTANGKDFSDWSPSYHRMFEAYGTKIVYQPWEYK